MFFATGPGGIHVFGNLAWGEDGSVLYVTANHWICRLQTLTRGQGF